MFKENRSLKEVGEASNQRDQSPRSELKKIRSDNLRRLGVDPKNSDTSSTQFGDLPGHIKHKIYDHLVQNFVSNEINTKEYIQSLDKLAQARLTGKNWTGQKSADFLLNHLYEDKVPPEFVKATVKFAYKLHPNRDIMLLELDQIIKDEQADLKKLCGAAKAMSFFIPEGSASAIFAEVKPRLVDKLTTGQSDERSYITKTLLYPPFIGRREVVEKICDRTVSLDARKDMIKVIGDTKDTNLKPLFRDITQEMRSNNALRNEIIIPLKKAYETLPNTTGILAVYRAETFPYVMNPTLNLYHLP